MTRVRSTPGQPPYHAEADAGTDHVPSADVDWFGLSGMLYRNALIRGDQSAVSDPRRDLTYRQLLATIRCIASDLRVGGLRDGDRVGILMGNRTEWLEYFFGALVAGGIVVPLGFYNTSAELHTLLHDAEARCLVIEPRYAHLVENDIPGCRVITVPDEREAPDLDLRPAPAPVTRPAATPEPRSRDTVALIQYTSGTSGRPKAVLHSHSTMMWNALHQIGDLQIDESTTTLVVPSLAWSAGLHDLTLSTLWAGGRVILYPSRGLEPRLLLETLASERVSHVFLSPSVLRRVADTEPSTRPGLESLRILLTGGEPMTPGLLDRLFERLGPLPIRPSYGLSEFPSTMTIMPPGEARRRPTSVGRATSIADIRIVDDTGRPVQSGVTGELVCRSPATMLGYRNDPDATALALQDGWLHTGDLATMDEDGYITIVGRTKDMLISGGLNVYCAEVERALLEHDAVTEAAVVGDPDDEWGQVPCAHLVLAADTDITQVDLETFLAAKLSSYKRPKRYVIYQHGLPRNAAGKVVKAALERRLPPETS